MPADPWHQKQAVNLSRYGIGGTERVIVIEWFVMTAWGPVFVLDGLLVLDGILKVSE